MKRCYFFLFFLSFLHSVSSKAHEATLEFVANLGQWKEPFLFKSVTPGGDIYLETFGITYMLGRSDNKDKIHAMKHNETKEAAVLNFHAYQMIFEGARNPSEITQEKLQEHYYNYFLGKDSSRWKTKIHPATKVHYKEIYPGVDFTAYSENNRFKYDFSVHPGAPPEQIQLRFKGTEGLFIEEGALKIRTSAGIVSELKPVAFQFINGKKTTVECRYQLKDSLVYFHFPKGYQKSSLLVIDPTVVFSTYSGSTADNWGFTATYDNDGSFYAGGIVNGTGYPVTTGAFQVVFGGGGPGGGNNTGGQPQMPCDMAITKFDPSGSTLIYSTYLGGSDNDQPHSMVVDAAGNLIVAGRTYSGDYPVQNPYDASHNGNADIVVTKFNASGTALLGSTYIGGSGDDGVNGSSIWSVSTVLKRNYGDDARSEVIVDKSGNIYVAAPSFSTDFPVQNAMQPTLGGGQDGVVFKLSSGLNTLLWSTYIGGSNHDAAYVLSLDNNEAHLFVAGGTQSTDFPVSAGGYLPSFQGGSSDGYILKFQNSGSYPLIAGTFLGAHKYDQCYGVQVDKQNKVYAMGQTVGGKFPVTPGVYSNPHSSQFVIKLENDLSAPVFSTVFGSGDSNTCNISPVAFLVDTCEQIYISGWGGVLSGQGGSTHNLPITPNAVQPTTDGSDFYFIVLSKDATGLLYSTYYGANSLQEHVDGGTSRFDKNGVIYQGICAGCSNSSAFPTTPGAYSNINGSSNCNYGALKISFDIPKPQAIAKITSDTIGCPPLTVHFSNSSTHAASYFWDFGDGNTSNAQNPGAHTFTTPGIFRVKLVVSNQNACSYQADSTFMTVYIDSSGIEADFSYTLVDSCDEFRAQFNNTSVYSKTPGSSGFTKFFWDFGDSSPVLETAHPGLHSFPDTGCYTIRLVMLDSTSCNESDTAEKVICFHKREVRAAFKADSACLGSAIPFANDSKDAVNYYWDFGDGNTSNAFAPQHTYSLPGRYTVTLVSENPGGCISKDTSVQIVEIWPAPKADFTSAPTIPVPNEPIQFTNKSTDADSYLWAFGDGTTTPEENPLHFYKRTGSYQVCLQAKNQYGCLDKRCRTVEAEIYPAIGVPTGFSPNGDGSNDILYVKGAAVETLNFKVYNRWGEKVFETDDIKTGWDGTFKGKPQEMDSYAWILSGTFVDGTGFNETGNVTLIR